MTGREIRDVLDRAGVLPSKQLGQNFLIDPNMARWIVSQLEVTPEDAVVEVGPGTGSLSEHLVGKVRRLILIEFDSRLAAALTEKYRDEPSVEVHHADGVKFDSRQLFKHRPLKFLGNLPYSCGGAIMKNLLSRPHPFERAVIMLQKEVIDRLAAKPGTKDYGILSLRTQANWQVAPLRTVPPEAFYPQPKIDSSVAVLTPRLSGLPTFDYRLFDELVRRGFAQRRKQLKKQLPDGPSWEETTAQLGVSATVRGEELTLGQWVDLTRAYDPHPLKDIPQKSGEIFDVVDLQDQVTHTATRAEVHAQKLLHRAVHVFVLNKRGDLLLQKRSPRFRGVLRRRRHARTSRGNGDFSRVPRRNRHPRPCCGDRLGARPSLPHPLRWVRPLPLRRSGCGDVVPPCRNHSLGCESPGRFRPGISRMLEKVHRSLVHEINRHPLCCGSFRPLLLR
jgi:16S rRNA (adenine1518-N6/adenine1519-N6)-dimethyltransferase